MQCGGTSATWGADTRPLNTACAACSTTSLPVNLTTPTTLAADPVARVGADAQRDCLSQWASYGAAWYLPLSTSSGVLSYSPVLTLSDCLALCSSDADCQLATYFSTSQECRIRRWERPRMAG
jgi:hypothetical protein